MVMRRRLDGFTESNDNDSDKQRIKQAAQRSIEKILDDNIEDVTGNVIAQVEANANIDAQDELRASPRQFKLACQRIIDDLLDLFK